MQAVSQKCAFAPSAGGVGNLGQNQSMEPNNPQHPTETPKDRIPLGRAAFLGTIAAGAIGAVDCACKTRTLEKIVAMIIGVAP